MSNIEDTYKETPEDRILKALEGSNAPLRSEQLTPEQFVFRSIERLRTPPYKGIHCVYSGFNGAFKRYFQALNPVDITKKLADEGKIVIRPVRGGVMLYKTGDVRQSVPSEDALRKILEDSE